MYGKDCHDKKCLFHTGRTGTYKCCSSPRRKMFMLCELCKVDWERREQVGLYKGLREAESA